MIPLGTLAFHRTALADLGALQRRIDTAQQAIATGTRLSRASDDPVASTTVARLDRASGDAAAHATNRQVARDSLATADTALQSMASLFVRARELSVQGRTGTLSGEDRAALGVEMLGLHDQLIGLANARDGRGRAVFGGGGEVAYAIGPDGAALYVGGDTASPVPVENGVTIAAIDVGEAVFGTAFEAVRALGQALASDGPLPAPADLLAGEARVGGALAGTGGRAARLDLLDAAAEAGGIGRANTRSALADTDLTEAIASMQQLLTTLQATQATYSRVSQLSLFDYLR